MRSYQIYHYTIPMDSQVVLRNRFLKQREGLLVQVECGEHEGWGEIAPLPEYSEETLEQATFQAREWLEDWAAQCCPCEKMRFTGLYPSVAFGLSCAMAELSGELSEAMNTRSAPLCYGDPDELYAKLNKMEGEKVAKIKVGLYEANRDGLITDMFLEAIPDLQLRLDANRAWTLEKARQFAKYIKPEHRARIQFIEEPCKTPELSVEFAREAGIALAWDESVREPHFEVNKSENVRAIVIKPTLVGSLECCIELIEQAHAKGMLAVISSAIESSFGLTQLARIAAQYTPETIPGLDTLDLMQTQIVRAWPGSTLPLAGLQSAVVKAI